MDFETSYTKGWYGKQEAWEKFVTAIKAVDTYEIDRLINANDTHAVDPDIFACASKDRDLMQSHKPAVVSDEGYKEELAFLHELVALRDVPFDSSAVNHLPEAYRVVSMFLSDRVQVSKRPAGVDYMTTQATWQSVQEGKPTETQQANGTVTTRILTGRDAATYVHNDDPLIPWLEATKYLLGQKVPMMVEAGMVANGAQSRFASCGLPHIYGTLGEGMKRLLPLSFGEKWTQLVPRPEENSVRLMGTLLPQTYAEGSPYHPSRNAMHFIAAAVMCGLLKLIFDKHVELPTGRTVEQELNLLRDNIGFWREWAGVHYPSDNSPYTPRAEALARRIVSQRYG